MISDLSAVHASLLSQRSHSDEYSMLDGPSSFNESRFVLVRLCVGYIVFFWEKFHPFKTFATTYLLTSPHEPLSTGAYMAKDSRMRLLWSGVRDPT